MKKFIKNIARFVLLAALHLQASAQGQGNNTQNTSVGMNALFSNTTGYNNTGAGFRALYFNTTGYENTATGFQSLYSNTEGFFNSAHGVSSLFMNTTGNSNTASGWLSLYSNSIGNANTAGGAFSLANNIGGGGNTGNGMQSLFFNSWGHNNTASGFDALALNTTGSLNTASGYQALFNNNTGFFNTAIGAYANVSSGNLFNATAIGYNAIASASNSVRVGNTGVTSIGGQVGWTTFSDGRYKSNIKNNVPGLEFINKLEPVTYTLNTTAVENKLNVDKKDLNSDKSKFNLKPEVDNVDMKQKMVNETSKITYTGFVAQDVEKVAKQIGYDFSGVDKPKDDGQSFYGLRYADFVVPLVKAVQELSAQNESLRTSNAELIERINKIEVSMGINTKQVPKTDLSIMLSSAKLDQNIPNPAKQSTLINYYVPESARHAEIQVTGISGELIKKVELRAKGNGQLNLQTALLNAGTYTYSLIVDGSIIDSKKMILIK